MAERKLRNVVPFPSRVASARSRPAESDRTALDRAEIALRLSESQLHLVTENVPAMIVYFDRDFVWDFPTRNTPGFSVLAKPAFWASTCRR
jgi:hypothetical protein